MKTKSKQLLITAWLVAVTHLGWAAPAVYSAQQIEDAKTAGAIAAGVDTSRSLDANGNVVTQQNSAQALRDGLTAFQTITGVTNATMGGSPSDGPGATGTASMTVNKSLNFSCSASVKGSPMTIGHWAFLKSACQSGDNNTVKAVTFLLCDNAKAAGVCYGTSGANNGDFSRTVTVPVGQYVDLDSARVGVGCNTSLQCLLTVTDTVSIAASDSSMRATAGSAAASSNFLQGMKTNVLENNYAKAITDNGATLKQGTTDAAATTSSSIGLSVEGQASCSTVRQCIQEATSTHRFTKTCNRTFPLTTRKSEYTYGDTLTCQITRSSGSRGNPGGVVASSCGDVSNGAYPPAGYTVIGATPSICTDDYCATLSSTEYLVNLSSKQLLGQSASPLKVAANGICDSSPNSSTRTVSCSNWFGRTVTNASACLDQAATFNPDLAPYLGLDYTQVAGCGVCTDSTINETCYGDPASDPHAALNQGEDTCSTMDLGQCTLLSASPLAGVSSLVTAQQETYSCAQDVKQCVKWDAPSPACANQDIAMGTQYLNTSNNNVLDGNFNNAMIAAATVNGTAHGLEGPQSSEVPRLFTGEGIGCRRPVGGLGDLFHEDCCRSDLMRPTKGNIIQGGCRMEEVKLSAARRSSYAHYIGSYCSRKVETWFFSFCLEETSSYCVFPGILPRLIQEQGRNQLATLTAFDPNAAIQRIPYTYQYYDATESGSWAPMQTVNGVRVSAWQWPSYCSDPQKAAITQSTGHAYQDTGMAAKVCPSVVTTYFAACDIAAGCDILPLQPTDGALSWTMHAVNPLEKATAAISKFAVVDGACNTQTNACSYQVSAWPVGIGGRAVVTKSLSWPLFAGADSSASSGTPTADQYQMNNIGDLMFKGYSAAPSSTLPTNVRMQFSSDGGSTWQEVQLPTTSLLSSEMTIPASDVKVTGGCDLSKNVCEFRATGTVTVSAKSWGSAQNPDCSGFSPGQIAVLDFSKMDLSEWLATVTTKLSADDPAKLAGAANAQFAAFNAQYSTNTVTSNAPSSANFARVYPAEGFGPFTATLSVIGYFPEITGDPARDTSNNRVTRVAVDWGDCGPEVALPNVDPSLGVGFRGVKQYGSPDDYGCLFAGGNVTHHITIKATLGDGTTQTKSVAVENAYATFPGAMSNNAKVSTSVTAPADQGTQAPPVKPNLSK